MIREVKAGGGGQEWLEEYVIWGYYINFDQLDPH